MKKRLNIKFIMAALLAAALIAVMAGQAWAYFTTYAEAQGGYEINLKDHEQIEEEVTDLEKQIAISNDADSTMPVFIRVQAYTGSQYNLTYTTGEGWTDGGDGWYYCTEPVAPGDKTPVLKAGIYDLGKEDVEDGQNINIVVVFESTPAIYAYDEANDSYTASADWSNILDKGESEIAKGGDQK